MATAYEVANYLIYLMNGVCDDLSNMKINKLLYYAQGHYLQKTGQALFSDKIEAWDHGPIVDDIYQRYKQYDNAPISNWDESILNRLSDEEQNYLIDIARVYSCFTASALRNMTYKPNGPWDRVYERGKYHTEIPVALIKDYFEKNIPEIKPIELDLGDDTFVGRRDKDDYLVLPAEYDDEAV